MATNESTAVNELIHLVINKPLARDSDEDLLFRAPRSAEPPVRMPTAGPAAPPVVSRVRPSRPARVDDTYIPTMAVKRQRLAHLAPVKVVVPLALLAIAGISIGGYLARSGHRAPAASLAHLAATAPAAQPIPILAIPKPAAPPVVAPPPAVPVAAPVKLVEIRLDSEPAGATVTIDHDGGLLGTTPMSASLDPSHGYDIVFTLAGHPARHEHLDPRATQHLVIALETPPEAPLPVVAKTSHHHHGKQVAAASSGTGMLMVSSKPPCEIIVDGKPTGLTAPQRAISLPAGSHKITLVNARRNINRTLGVQIKPGRSTKLIRDFMKK